MQSRTDDLEKRYTKWLMAYRITQALLVVNMALFFFNFFTEWKSAYQIIYGESLWPAVGIAVVLTLFLSKAYSATHFYHWLLTEDEV